MKIQFRENKKVNSLYGIVTIFVAFAPFLTGKQDVKSFFENVTFSNFIYTFLKTISAYSITILVIIFSFFIIFDFILIIFELHFPIAHFLYVSCFSNVVIDWWWKNSLPENIFLSSILLYLLTVIKIETKKKFYYFIYYRSGKKINGFSLGLLLNDMKRNFEGIEISLVIVKHKESESKYLNIEKNE